MARLSILPLLAVVGMMLATGAAAPEQAAPASPSEAQHQPWPDGPDFPRLAMWHPNWDLYTIEDCARYDLLVGSFQDKVYYKSSGMTFAEALKKVNPDIELLTYFTTSVIRHSSIEKGTFKTNPYLPDWPARWFLTEAGTTLSAEIDAKTETIPVTDWRQSGQVLGNQPTEWDIFRPGHDILCDGEIMTIRTVDDRTKTLDVKRAMNGTKAKVHPAGVRIAPIIRFWLGSYVMNLTSNCPTATLHGATQPETYGDYSFRMSKVDATHWWWYIGGKQDGFLWDLMGDKITWLLQANTRCIDLDQDNVADDLALLDTKWLEGINHVHDIFTRDYPDAPIARNVSRSRRFEAFNGEHFVAFPLKDWENWDLDRVNAKTRQWHRYFFGDPPTDQGGILEFAAASPEVNCTIIETTELETDLDENGQPWVLNPLDWVDYVPEYSKMRWGLTSALIAGVPYSWVLHTDGHGLLGLWWFDEYDNVGEGVGYLGQPVGSFQKVATDKGNKRWGAYAREYDNGYVICNPLGREIEVTLPPGQWRRINGRQDHDVNNGNLEQGTIKIPAYDGLILLRDAAPVSPQS